MQGQFRRQARSGKLLTVQASGDQRWESLIRKKVTSAAEMCAAEVSEWMS